MLWVAQATVPWTRRGTFSSSSMLDGARLLRTGMFESAAPRWVAVLLVLVPAMGVLVGATAGLRGQPLWVIRLGCVAFVAVAHAFFVHNVAGANLARLGPGGWLTSAGILTGALGLAWTRATWGQAARGRPG